MEVSTVALHGPDTRVLTSPWYEAKCPHVSAPLHTLRGDKAPAVPSAAECLGDY